MKKILQLFCLLGLIAIQSCSNNAEFTPNVMLKDVGVDHLGGPIRYPTQPPKVESRINVRQPGHEGGWHKHPVPKHLYLLQGEITFEYDTNPKITKVFSKGDAFIEAQDVWHKSTVTSDVPAVIFNFIMGAEGIENNIFRE